MLESVRILFSIIFVDKTQCLWNNHLFLLTSFYKFSSGRFSYWHYRCSGEQTRSELLEHSTSLPSWNGCKHPIICFTINPSARLRCFFSVAQRHHVSSRIIEDKIRSYPHQSLSFCNIIHLFKKWLWFAVVLSMLLCGLQTNVAVKMWRELNEPLTQWRQNI